MSNKRNTILIISILCLTLWGACKEESKNDEADSDMSKIALSFDGNQYDLAGSRIVFSVYEGYANEDGVLSAAKDRVEFALSGEDSPEGNLDASGVHWNVSFRYNIETGTSIFTTSPFVAEHAMSDTASSVILIDGKSYSAESFVVKYSIVGDEVEGTWSGEMVHFSGPDSAERKAATATFRGKYAIVCNPYTANTDETDYDSTSTPPDTFTGDPDFMNRYDC